MFKVLSAFAMLGCATSFMATSPITRSTKISMVSENIQTKITKALVAASMGVALLTPLTPAVADGAVSVSTVYRARNLYGSRILELEQAAAKGDFAAFSNSKAVNGFDLFISRSNALGGKAAKQLASAEKKLEGDIYAAVKAKDAAKLKSSFDEFVKVADLKSDYKPG